MLALAIAVIIAQPDPSPDCRPGSDWWVANEANADALASCEAALRTLATDTHTHAQQTRDRGQYVKARDLYRAYLRAFGPGPRLSDEAFNLSFYLAEVLWALESFVEAIGQYEAVVHFELPSRESAKLAANLRYRQMAEFNVVLAWGKLVARERGTPVDDRKAPPIGARRTPLSRFEAKLVRAADDFVLRHHDAAGAELAVEAALVFAERGHVSEARLRLDAIVARWPGEPSAHKAAAMIARLPGR